MPDDLATAIAEDPAAQAMWAVLTKTSRYSLLQKVPTVKPADTRTRNIALVVTMLARGETPYPQQRRPTP